MEKENCFIVREDGTVLLNEEIVPRVLSFSVSAEGLERSIVTMTFLAEKIDVSHGVKRTS